MTEQQLVAKIQELKQIKPRKDWVVLAKMDILKSDITTELKKTVQPSHKSTFASILVGVTHQRKFAFSLVVFLFIATGLFGFMKYNLPNGTQEVKVAEQSSENLVAIKSSVEDFKVKSRNLSQMANLNSQDISLAVKEIKDSAQELASAIKDDPQLAKEVALDINNNKTYLNIQGGEDLKDTLDVLYKVTDEQIIEDLQKTTLTESQQKALDKAIELFEKKDFTNSLESLLLLDMAIKSE